VRHPLNKAVFERIEMNVVDVSLKIALIANRVLPKAPLPQCQIAIWSAGEIDAGVNQGAIEITLDPSPSARKIGICRWQGKNRMEVIRQDDDCVDRKLTLSTRRTESIAQRCDMIDKGA